MFLLPPGDLMSRTLNLLTPASMEPTARCGSLEEAILTVMYCNSSQVSKTRCSGRHWTTRTHASTYTSVPQHLLCLSVRQRDASESSDLVWTNKPFSPSEELPPSAAHEVTQHEPAKLIITSLFSKMNLFMNTNLISTHFHFSIR